MALPPPDAVVTVTVAQIAPAGWTFSSPTSGLVSPTGNIDLKGAGFTQTPVQIKFTIVPGPGISISAPPTIVVWDQKSGAQNCAQADKDVPDPQQVDKITYIDNYDVQIKYKNKTGSMNGRSLKCNFYSMYLYVGATGGDSTLQTLDPVVTNGDGSGTFCTDGSGHPIICLGAKHRKNRTHAPSPR